MADLGPRGDVTELLAEWGRGSEAALETATQIVYGELHRIAASFVGRDPGTTMQPTALINEAYLRLIQERHLSFENRRRFFAFAARLMRQVLADYARMAGAEKRGGDVVKLPLSDSVGLDPQQSTRYLALHEAIEKLAEMNPRKAQIVELRYFAGLNLEETAAILEISTATISREQRMAEAWLSLALETGGR